MGLAKGIPSNVLVTGGAGFIGSALVRLLVEQGCQVTVLDALTYAGRRENLHGITGPGSVSLEVGDIVDGARDFEVLQKSQPQWIFHLAAESHVDRSIQGPAAFVRTNVVGSYVLLQSALEYWKALGTQQRGDFRFLQISTDEVFGSLGKEGLFSEASAFQPRSPYAASKASADHFGSAWFHTFGLPVLRTHCSNNYGPRQFPEKLIPLMIRRALAGQTLPVYGDGSNVRDWIHVQDHCRGLILAAQRGKIGEAYCFSGRSERDNLSLVRELCRILDELKPRKGNAHYAELIEFVADRPGHDWRYAIDDSRARSELGFKTEHSFKDGLRATVEWYLGEGA